jgi:hypothetical protein
MDAKRRYREGRKTEFLAADRTHCPEGHPYDEENTYVRKDGSRQCKACAREYQRERRSRASMS